MYVARRAGCEAHRAVAGHRGTPSVRAPDLLVGLRSARSMRRHGAIVALHGVPLFISSAGPQAGRDAEQRPSPRRDEVREARRRPRWAGRGVASRGERRGAAQCGGGVPRGLSVAESMGYLIFVLFCLRLCPASRRIRRAEGSGTVWRADGGGRNAGLCCAALHASSWSLSRFFFQAVQPCEPLRYGLAVKARWAASRGGCGSGRRRGEVVGVGKWGQAFLRGCSALTFLRVRGGTPANQNFSGRPCEAGEAV